MYVSFPPQAPKYRWIFEGKNSVRSGKLLNSGIRSCLLLSTLSVCEITPSIFTFCKTAKQNNQNQYGGKLWIFSEDFPLDFYSVNIVIKVCMALKFTYLVSYKNIYITCKIWITIIVKSVCYLPFIDCDDIIIILCVRRITNTIYTVKIWDRTAVRWPGCSVDWSLLVAQKQIKDKGKFRKAHGLFCFVICLSES